LSEITDIGGDAPYTSVMQVLLVLKLLVLLLVANGTPVIAKKVLGRRLACAVDGGVRFFDGQRLLGSSKTVRGVCSSIIVTTLCAPLVGFEWKVGAVIGSAAMAGDLFSSFLKRRLRLPASSRATGLDQLPESLCPLVACGPMLALTVADIVGGVLLFFIGELVLSLLFYKLGVRRRPY
jgi:CDP-2,3-bis-(O-geranylgeranyl)-sn-glycerol synthase